MNIRPSFLMLPHDIQGRIAANLPTLSDIARLRMSRKMHTDGKRFLDPDTLHTADHIRASALENSTLRDLFQISFEGASPFSTSALVSLGKLRRGQTGIDFQRLYCGSNRDESSDLRFLALIVACNRLRATPDAAHVLALTPADVPLPQSPIERAALLTSPHGNPQIVAKMARAATSPFEMASIAMHPFTSEADIESLLQGLADPKARAMILQTSPHLPQAKAALLITKLAQTASDPAERRALLRASFISDEALAALATSAPDAAERSDILYHPAASRSTFRACVASATSFEDFDAIIEHPATTGVLLHAIAVCAKKLVDAQVAPLTGAERKQFLTSRVYESTSSSERMALVDHEETLDSLAAYLARTACRPAERAYMLTHTDAAHLTLTALAKQTIDPRERLLLASNPYASISTLNALTLTETDPRILSELKRIRTTRFIKWLPDQRFENRAAQIRRNILSATNPATTARELHSLANRVSTEQELYEIVRNPNVHQTTLRSIGVPTQGLSAIALATHPNSDPDLVRKILNHSTSSYIRAEITRKTGIGV